MPMYNLIEYSKNYRKTTGSLWNYYRDELNDFPADNDNANLLTNVESFKYKGHIIGKTSKANQKTVKTLTKIIQRFKKVLKLLFH